MHKKGNKKYWQQRNQFNSNKTVILKLLNKHRVKPVIDAALMNMCHVIAEWLKIRLAINVKIWGI